MRPFGIVLGNEVVEAFLLLDDVGTRWAGGFTLEREVHALVAAVLLRMARLDALDGDAEPQPPDRELRQVEQAVRAGEGQAVVGADGVRQAALEEEPLKGCDDRLLARRFHGFAQEQEARGVIGDGERITPASIAELELALEVGRP